MRAASSTRAREGDFATSRSSSSTLPTSCLTTGSASGAREKSAPKRLHPSRTSSHADCTTWLWAAAAVLLRRTLRPISRLP